MGERLELELTGLAHGGEAFGRHAGRIIFVPYGAPGDRVAVELVEEKARWARGRLLDVLRPSPDRAEPPCPYYGTCTGCQLQHVAYAAQLAGKEEVVRDQLARLGRLRDAPVRPVVGVDHPWEYRNQAHLYPTPAGGLGIRAGSNPEPVAVEHCLLFHPLLAELHAALDLDVEGLRRIGLRAGIRTGEQLILFEMVGDAAPELEVDLPISCVLRVGDEPRVMAGDEWLWEVMAGRRIRISALSPFPAHTALLEAVVETVRGYLRPGADDLLVDAGAGVGVFGLSLLEAAAGLIAIEEDGWAVSDLLANAGEAANLGVIQDSLAEGLAAIDQPVDLAIVQPGRSGLGREGARALAELAPRRVAYVASDPAALARDAGSLQEAGYALVEVQPFDLLPQTYQVWAAGLWERRAG